VNKYLEKIAEDKKTLRQSAGELAATAAGSAAVGGYLGKLEHEKQVSNVARGVTKPRSVSDIAMGHHSAREAERAVSGRKISPLLDKAFKKQHIAAKAKKFGAIGAGVSLVGDALGRMSGSKDD
jgi:hypothetical protein